MADTKDQYEKLFGSSDEESDDEKKEKVMGADEDGDDAEGPPSPPPSTSKQAGEAGGNDTSGSSSDSSSGDSSDSNSSDSSSDEDARPVKKRIIKRKKVVRRARPASSDTSSDEDSDDDAVKKAPSRKLGSSALARATEEFQEEEEEEEENASSAARPPVDYDSYSTDSSDDRRRRRQAKRGGGKKVRSKGERRSSEGAGGSSSRAAPGRELTVVEKALEKMKRGKNQKLADQEIANQTQKLISIMETASQEDAQALRQHRPATEKLKNLNTVMDLLKSKHLQGALVDNGQILGLIAQWLAPLPDKSLPMFAVRTPLIDYLVTARVEVHRLKESGIGRIIQKLKKHPQETDENRAKLTEIVNNWSRLITGKGTTIKARSYEDMEAGDSNRQGGAGGLNGDGYFISRTSRGVEIPVRTGFNFKKVALTFREEFDRGQGKEDEALEVMERGERGDGFESRTSKVRKALKDMGRKGSGKKLRAENVSHAS